MKGYCLGMATAHLSIGSLHGFIDLMLAVTEPLNFRHQAGDNIPVDQPGMVERRSRQ